MSRSLKVTGGGGRAVKEKSYTADLSLRLSHESLDLSVICDALEMQPRVIWKAGDRRETPAGTPLEGIRSESYCSIDLLPKSPRPLERQMEEALALLERHDPTLRDFHREGGKALVCIGWFFDAHSGATLDPSTVERLSRLHIGLDIHVYVPDVPDGTDIRG